MAGWITQQQTRRLIVLQILILSSRLTSARSPLILPILILPYPVSMSVDGHQGCERPLSGYCLPGVGSHLIVCAFTSSMISFNHVQC